MNPIPANQAVLAVVETDHGVYDEATRKEIAAALKRIDMTDAETADDDDMEIKVCWILCILCDCAQLYSYRLLLLFNSWCCMMFNCFDCKMWKCDTFITLRLEWIF